MGTGRFRGSRNALKLVLICAILTVFSAIGYAQTPAITAAGVVSSASYAQGAVAPGSIISIFGTDLAGSEYPASMVPLPSNLGGTQVIIGGFAAPLFYVSPTQINAQIPWQAPASGTLSIQVLRNSVGSALVSMPATALSPGLYTMNSNGAGTVVISNTSTLVQPTGSISGVTSRPANPGEYITIYCTGLGPVSNTPLSGAVASGQLLSATSTSPVVTIDGITVPVIFSGLTPGSVGLYQINVQVPSAVPGGSEVPVVV